MKKNTKKCVVIELINEIWYCYEAGTNSTHWDAFFTDTTYDGICEKCNNQNYSIIETIENE